MRELFMRCSREESRLMLTSVRLPLMEVRTIIYCSSGFTVLRANERSCNRWRLSFELKSLWDRRSWKCRAALMLRLKSTPMPMSSFRRNYMKWKKLYMR
ncbi:hypothetical protein CsSME_00002063 [Camellia sinensis var. sinensis]